MQNITALRFKNENAARKHLEAIRWPDGPICPHCGSVDKSHRIKGTSARPGLWFCAKCRKQYTVTVGTVFERSKIPLHKWLLAVHLLSASKKGMSAHQLHRMLGVTYKTAWFMAHRIREAMRDLDPSPMGGPDEPVQADETYFGKVEAPLTTTTSGRPFTKSGRSGPANKRALLTLVSGGQARTFHIARADSRTVRHILVTNARREAELHTDESRIYTRLGREFAAHRTVNHSAGEYVGPSGYTTNAVENYFSIFKRGMKGVYQHCAEKHLHRYAVEFDFRFNARNIEDAERADKALKGIGGKRLTYRRTNEAANA